MPEFPLRGVSTWQYRAVLPEMAENLHFRPDEGRGGRARHHVLADAVYASQRLFVDVGLSHRLRCARLSDPCPTNFPIYLRFAL